MEAVRGTWAVQRAVPARSSKPSALKGLLELGPREDRLRLLQSLDLLVAGGLADLKVLEHEVAALLQLQLVVRELLQLQLRGLQLLLGLGLVGLRLGLLLRLVHDGLAVRLDR